MASPALAGLILEFFYTGTSALAGLFPEVFAQEVPKSVVCLAATAVSTSFLLAFILMLSFTAASCYRRVYDHRSPTRPPIRVQYLFQNFYTAYGYASQN